VTALRVYVAASALEIPRAKLAMSRLEAGGIAVTSTWVTSIEAVGVSNPRDATADQRRAWSVADFAELRAADVLWLLAPAAGAPTRGAWAELGFAHGIGKAIVCSGDTRQSIFCALGSEYESDNEALGAICAMAIGRDNKPENACPIEQAKERCREQFGAVYPEDVQRAKAKEPTPGDSTP
jgi:hypothetical protein